MGLSTSLWWFMFLPTDHDAIKPILFMNSLECGDLVMSETIAHNSPYVKQEIRQKASNLLSSVTLNLCYQYSFGYYNHRNTASLLKHHAHIDQCPHTAYLDGICQIHLQFDKFNRHVLLMQNSQIT